MSPEPEVFPASPAAFAQSDLFARTDAEGMALVEEAAAFLEGPGRDAAKDLSRPAALAYAGESMRLTTRLMQIASWLMVHRAVRSGEMTNDEARAERYRLLSDDVLRSADREGRGELPATLWDLIERCDRLYARLVRLDERLTRTSRSAAPDNPVGQQLEALEAALRAVRP